MKCKSIYIQIFSSTHLGLAKALQKQGDIISIIETSEKFYPTVKLIFPNSYIFTTYEFLLSLNTPNKFVTHCTFAELMNSYPIIAENYLVLTHLASRITWHDQLLMCDKNILYLNVLYTLCSILDSYPVDLGVFMNEPHQIHDYLLSKLLISRNKRCIQILKTSISAYSIARVISHSSISPIRNPNAPSLRLKDLIQTHIRNKMSQVQSYDPRTSVKLRKSTFSPDKSLFLYKVSSVINSFIFYLKQIYHRVKEIVNPQARYSLFYYAIANNLRRRLDIASAFSRIHSDQIPNNKKKILLPLQCTPERQSMPGAMPYYEQANLVAFLDLFCKVNDFILVVKEHPSQFRSYQRVHLGRSSSFYSQYRNSRTTFFVSSFSDTYKLIDSSEVVIGFGGSVCWEAILKGKPTVPLGDPWYGSLKVKNKIDLPLSQFCISDKLKNHKLNVTDLEISDHHHSISNWLLANIFSFDHDSFESMESPETSLEQLACAIVSQ